MIEKVLLTIQEEINCRCHDGCGLLDIEKLNKTQCLKLLEWLEKEEQIHHTYRYTLKYPYKRLGCSPTCKLCELESKLK